jgi:hypothetical protein
MTVFIDRAISIRIIAALFATLVVPATASAQLIVNGGVEYFRWTEDTTPKVKESGPIGFIGLSYRQPRDAGVLFGYSGKLWGGSVDYDGALMNSNTPISSTTNYIGLNNEIQARYRKAGTNGGSLDGVFGLGLDVWRRSLSSIQKEDYSIVYGRVGVESKANYAGQWIVGLGIKYPLWTYENAHFDRLQAGYDSNPILHPGKEISPYGSIGYRFTQKFQLSAYYESLRFDRSDSANVLQNGQPFTVWQPASNMEVFGLRLEYLMR